MPMLPITLTIAAAAALINVWLVFRTGQVRHRSGVSIGDGGNPALIARMRAQSNFIEHAPIFLILLGLVEHARGPQTWLWIVAIVFILARIAHPLGMDRPSPNALRAGGIIASIAATIVLAVYALAIPYLGSAGGSATTITFG